MGLAFYDDLTEEQIRTLAFELWRNAGEREGEVEKFWYQAEKELLRRRDVRPRD
jgi:Protein of unknown function (DUF2934)